MARDRKISKRIIVPPKSGKAFNIRKGGRFRIIDKEGGQPGDMVAFSEEDHSKVFSQSRTRVENSKFRLFKGDKLWTSGQPPHVMLIITHDDTKGMHDLLFTPCCRYALEKRFDVSCEGCLEHLARACNDFGIDIEQIPDPLNLFFDVQTFPDGRITTGNRSSGKGDSVEFKAEMDCIVAVTTCSVPRPENRNSSYIIEFLD